MKNIAAVVIILSMVLTAAPFAVNAGALDGITTVMTLPVSFDTYINTGDGDRVREQEDNFIAGGSRIAFLRFDTAELKQQLQQASGKVASVQLQLFWYYTNATSNIYLKYLPDDVNWDANLTYNIYNNSSSLKNAAAETADWFMPTGTNNTNKEFRLDVTDIFNREISRQDIQSGNDVASLLSFTLSGSGTAPCFRSKEYSGGAYQPALIITVLNAPEFSGGSGVKFSDAEYIPVSKDTYIQSNDAGSSKGADESIIAGGSRTAYLQFDISGVSAPVAKAEIRLYWYWTSASSDINVKYVPYDDWDENMTYNNSPVKAIAGEQLATFKPSGTNGADKLYTIDVTSLVSREYARQDAKTAGDWAKLLTFSMDGAGTAPMFRSKEYQNGSYRPTLVVTYANKGFYEENTQSGVLNVNGKYYGYRRLGRYISSNNYAPGELAFELKCDPEAQNYLTVQFWGSDTGSGMIWLTAPFSNKINPAILTSQPNLIETKSTPQFEGRFIYVTYLIPKSITNGKTSVFLKLSSTGASSPYSQDSKVQPQSEMSRGVYAAYMSTNPFYQPPDSDITGGAVPVAKDPVNNYSVTEEDYLKSLCTNGVNQFKDVYSMYGPVFNSQVSAGILDPIFEGMILKNGDWKSSSTLANKGITSASANKQLFKDTYYGSTLVQNMTMFNAFEIFALAYYGDFYNFGSGDSGAAARADMFNRILKSFDFLTVSQGANGGWYSSDGKWIGAPARRNAGGNSLEGFGVRSMAKAFVLMYNDLKAKDGNGNCALDATINHDDDILTPAVTRWQAYSDMFKKARDYLTSAGVGHAPNQDMANIEAALLLDVCLRLMDGDRGTNTAFSQSERERLFKIAFGLERNNFNDSFWVSEKGTALESGGSVGGSYTGDYGSNLIVNLGYLAELAKESNVSAEVCAQLDQRLWQAYDVIEKYYFIGNSSLSTDPANMPVLYTEGVTSWRNTGYPGTERYPLDCYGATVLKHPAAIRIADLYLKHLKIYLNGISTPGNTHYADNVLDAIHFLINLGRYRAAINDPVYTGYKFPMERNGGDFAWADEMAQTVVIKNGGDRIYMTFNWRHPYRDVNGIGVIHYTTDNFDRIAYVAVDNSQPNPQSGYYGYEEGKNPPVTNANGDTDHFSGFSTLQYGKYLVCMNAREIALPLPAKPMVCKDLISGKRYDLRAGNTNMIPASSTMVLVPDDGAKWMVSGVEDASGSPVAALTANGTIGKVTVLNNADSANGSAFVAVALYNENNVLYKVFAQEVYAEKGNVAEIQPGLTLPENAAGYKLRVFIWSGRDRLTPLAEAYTLPN